ncbi:MAG: hypothetical protein Fur0022_15660 [Anaerolineales bacterium]
MAVEHSQQTGRPPVHSHFLVQFPHCGRDWSFAHFHHPTGDGPTPVIVPLNEEQFSLPKHHRTRTNEGSQIKVGWNFR